MILDYVKDYGSKSFDVEPINVLDLLVFTELSYFDYPRDCWGESLPKAMRAVSHFTIQPAGQVRPRLVTLEQSHDEELRTLVAHASRYEDVMVRSFASDYEESSHQIGALSLMIDDVLVVLYRGTDESITGWNEALQLSLDVPLVGQELARSYLEEQASNTFGPIICCGHSKGGNLAAYAAVTCAGDQKVAARIAAVVSFDGPGLPEALRNTRPYAMIESRVMAFIPKSSFIGSIHEHPPGSITYIDSREAFVAQHFVYNWKTNGTHLVPCKQSLAGKLGSGALNLLIDNLNDRQKNRIFDALLYFPKRAHRTS